MLNAKIKRFGEIFHLQSLFGGHFRPAAGVGCEQFRVGDIARSAKDPVCIAGFRGERKFLAEHRAFILYPESQGACFCPD